MASSLILHKRINTTMAKAKALRGYVEPLITKTKSDSTHQRRIVFSYLQNKEAVKELFGNVATKVANRNGGYTRILKLGRRMGDGAEMVMMELVDYNEAMLKDTTAKKAKTTRRGGKKKAVATEEVAAPAPEATVEVAEEKAE
jgi:large subunit ribosomal protein L17